ncbi:MAG TPA: dihydroorotate dehydrogenase electron transfer subunit [Candidatus Gastranaerophilales bacterium]|nr:dihydroorotate dehydrogenase electron transfer subunit [Candidatus Gastranaerophilales bacterium]
MQNLKDQNLIRVSKGPFFAKVLENREISDNIYKLRIESEEIAQNSLPGQFVSIKCADLTLRRPFSVAGVRENSFDLLYKVKGTGTEWLTNLKTGDITDIIGPMGNGFSIENKKSLLIGCGVGIAPIDFFMDVLSAKSLPYKSIGCFRSKYKNAKEYDYHITEDGTSALKGKLSDYLEQIITETATEKIFICGPNPAMQYVTEYALSLNIETEVALEGDFACGTGVCMGCAIKIKKGNALESAKICKDGPVFKGEEVVWR